LDRHSNDSLMRNQRSHHQQLRNQTILSRTIYITAKTKGTWYSQNQRINGLINAPF